MRSIRTNSRLNKPGQQVVGRRVYLAAACALALTISLLGAGHAQAAIESILFEDNGDVVFEYSGSINTDGLSTLNAGGFTGGQIDPSKGIVYSMAPGISPDVYEIAPVPAFGSIFGAGNEVRSHTGDSFGFANDFGGELLLAPGYVSNDNLLGRAVFEGTSFAEFGVIPGTYSVDIGNGDTITLTVVPEPTSLALLGLGGLALFRRSRTARGC